MGIKINKKVAGVTETTTSDDPVEKISKDDAKPSYSKMMKDAQATKKSKAQVPVEDAMDADLKQVETEMTEAEAEDIINTVIAEEYDNPTTAADVVKKLKGKDSVGTVSKTFNDGSVVDETEVVKAAVLMENPPANVGVSCGLTRNIGNYESLKFQVSINIPCEANAEDIEDTYEQAKSWVDTKIDEINAEVNSSLGE